MVASDFLKMRSKKSGLPAGSIVYVGDSQPTETVISVFLYDANNCQEFKSITLADLQNMMSEKRPEQIIWINIAGLSDIELIKSVGAMFHVHALSIEDVLNTHQRTKIEDFDDFVFVVLKMLEPLENQFPLTRIHMEQVSLIMGKDFVVSVQQDQQDIFNPLREQLRQNKGKVRTSGADFLLYALLDNLVDAYFVVLEQFGETIEHLEDKLLANPASQTLQHIHQLRQQLIDFRRAVWPLREILNHLMRGNTPLIKPETHYYLRDVYDHVVNVIDNTESNREIVAGMIELYLSSVSYQLNVVMKVLTIFTAIFIPLTFVCSVYGMNFTNMPEITAPWGYPMVWAINIAITIGMLIYFKAKKWL